VGPGAILRRAHRTSLRVPSPSPHHKALHTPRAPIGPNPPPSPTPAAPGTRNPVTLSTDTWPLGIPWTHTSVKGHPHVRVLEAIRLPCALRWDSSGDTSPCGAALPIPASSVILPWVQGVSERALGEVGFDFSPRLRATAATAHWWPRPFTCPAQRWAATWWLAAGQ